MGRLVVERQGEIFGGLPAQAGFTLSIIRSRKKEEKARNEGENQASV
jgi:hypothetical protein